MVSGTIFSYRHDRKKIDLNSQLIKAMADRKTGVGFDQLLTISAPTDPESDFLYRIFNADASEAEQCGNGARCIHTFVREKGLTSRKEINFKQRKDLSDACYRKTKIFPLRCQHPISALREINFRL